MKESMVGVVANMQDEDVQLEIGGTLQQRISSCLQCLDKFLKQDAVIVSSKVVAEKKAGGSSCGNFVDTVGIKDLKAVSHQVSLAELGMDSMMAAEIKQNLERKSVTFLTAKDIRTLTFGRLVELTAIREAAASTAATSRPVSDDGTSGLRTLIRNFGEEKLATEPFIYMPTMVSDESEMDVSVHENERIMIMLPGLEGCAEPMAPLCKRLKVKICVLQLGIEFKNDTLETLVYRLHQTIKTRLPQCKSYILLGYSFGCLPMLKLASILEGEGHAGTIFCVDGSPDYLNAILTMIINIQNDTILQNSLICRIIDTVHPNNDITDTVMEKLMEIESHEEKIDYAIKICPVQSNYSKKFISNISMVCFDRLKMILNHTESDIKKLKAPVILFRAKEQPQQLAVEENYGLDKVTEGPVTVHYLAGNHVTIIENKDCANIINRVLAAQEKRSKHA